MERSGWDPLTLGGFGRCTSLAAAALVKFYWRTGGGGCELPSVGLCRIESKQERKKKGRADTRTSEASMRTSLLPFGMPLVLPWL